MLLRITVGLSLAMIGLAHYLDFTAFTQMAEGGLGSLTVIGTIGAYVIPALEIVAGLWFAIDAKNMWAGKLVGLTFLLICVGLLLKPLFGSATLTDVMPMVQGTLVWALVAAVAVSMPACGHDK